MTSTFLITIQLEDLSPLVLLEESENIHDAVEKAGFEVLEVKPWAHPVSAPSLPEQQTNTQQS